MELFVITVGLTCLVVIGLFLINACIKAGYQYSLLHFISMAITKKELEAIDNATKY